MSEDFSQNEKSLGKGWDDSERIMEERSGGLFLKVEDGKSVFINIISEPEVYEKEFKPGDGMRARVKVDVWVPGDEKAKTWDMSNTVFKQLKRQRVRRGDAFDKAVFELGREGTGMETKYWIEFARELSAAELKQRESVLPF